MSTILRDAAISFPMLGDWTINPPAYFILFGHTFYWYGAIIALGFILAATYCAHNAPRFGLTSDNLYDLVLWVLPIGILGARFYYVVSEWADYSENFLDVFKIWKGGLAIYGGIIAGVITATIWCRNKRIPISATLDLCSFGVLIGQTIGRWGNFINREAFGYETNIFCRMGLTPQGQETIYVHPTFLYESLWNLTGFILLNIWVRKNARKYDGQVFILYVLWYGIGRAFVEGLRTDSLYITGTDIRVSQLVAAVSAITAVVALIINARRSHPEMFVNRAKESANASIDPEADEHK